MERDHVPGSDDSGAITWRNFVRTFSGTIGRLRGRDVDGGGRVALDVAHQDAAADAAARTSELENGVCGIELYLAGETDSGSDFAGPVRGAAGRSRGAASGVRAGNSAHRSLGTGIFANRARNWRGADGSGAGTSSAAGACGTDAAVVGGRVRDLHNFVWRLDEFSVVPDFADLSGCGRYDQRDYSCHPGSTAHAR